MEFLLFDFPHCIKIWDVSNTMQTFKDLAAGLQSIATIVSFIVAGIWVYRRYVRGQEKHSNIEFSVALNFIGTHADSWIVEVVALVENKGKVQHTMQDFTFDLDGLLETDPVELSQTFGNQVHFPHILVSAGNFMPQRTDTFFIDPGLAAKYSYVTKVPINARFLMVHAQFKYHDRNESSHSAEKTVAVPAYSKPNSAQEAD